MASALRLVLPPPHHPQRRHSPSTTITNCSPNPPPQPDDTNNGPPPNTTTELEPRRKSLITDRRGYAAIQKPEPPNFEIGWKRTKEIKTEKPKGWEIADFLEKLETLMARGQYGSAELLAKVGAIVAERAREETELLTEREEIDERLVTELYRVLRLIEMDMEMVKAAVKPETLAERLEQAKVRCRQAILVALSF